MTDSPNQTLRLVISKDEFIEMLRDYGLLPYRRDVDRDGLGVMVAEYQDADHKFVIGMHIDPTFPIVVVVPLLDKKDVNDVDD